MENKTYSRGFYVDGRRYTVSVAVSGGHAVETVTAPGGKEIFRGEYPAERLRGRPSEYCAWRATGIVETLSKREGAFRMPFA